MTTKNENDYIKYKRLSNQVRYMTRKLVKNLEKNLSKQAKKNPKVFWNYVNSKR